MGVNISIIVTFMHLIRHTTIQNTIEKLTLDVLTLSVTLYDLSVSRNLFVKGEKRQFSAAGTEVLQRRLETLVPNQLAFFVILSRKG